MQCAKHINTYFLRFKILDGNGACCSLPRCGVDMTRTNVYGRCPSPIHLLPISRGIISEVLLAAPNLGSFVYFFKSKNAVFQPKGTSSTLAPSSLSHKAPDFPQTWAGKALVPRGQAAPSPHRGHGHRGGRPCGDLCHPTGVWG